MIGALLPQYPPHDRDGSGISVYSSRVPVATYPGTVTPLRGLGSFTESERDVFFGRDQEREQLANLVTDSSYRAGLLYGESGVGRTSLLRAGLQPSLRDHGVVALFCEDNNQPLDSFARALAQASGQVAKERETAASYLARVIGQAAQMYLFILDDIDLMMSRDERVCAEVAELFTRVASRSAGRARFLFSCASDRVHAFAALELRTGSLFPPASRFELCGMAAPEATLVLERTVALAGIPCEEDLVPAIIADLSRKSRKSRSYSNSILPSDLQIAAIAIKELGIASAEQFQREGGYTQLENRWVVLATQATGNERSAMRLLAVLAANGIMQPCPASSVARQANVDIEFAQGALATLQTRGLVQGNAAVNSEELHYSLRHEVLAPRLRQQAAPAAISAQKAYEILGAKAAQEKGLSRREYKELRREGIVPSTPEEKAVITKTLMRAKVALFGAAALPILVVAFVYVSMSGSYYLDTAHGVEGTETIVVRAGKSGLSWFNWLPKSPSFGSIVADTGLTSRMVSESTWQKASSHDISGSLDGAEYVDQTKTARSAGLAAVLLYAQNGDAAALAKMEKDLKSPEEFIHFLRLLLGIAHGAAEEVQLLEQALAFPSSALQTEALALATAAETRHPGSYATFIANALASSDTQRRRIAIAALRSVDSKRAILMIQAALDNGPDDEAGQELRALLSGDSQPKNTENSQAGNTGTNTLGASIGTKLDRAFQFDSAAATTDAITVVANESADAKERIAAINLLIDNAPQSSLASLDASLRTVRSSKSPEVADAILPLLARAQPVNVASELVAIANAGKLTTKKSVILARSWGQIARSDETIRAEAGAVLERLLKSEDREIRAAAAEAYGFTGKSAQEELIKIVKTEFKQVAQSAAMGLANSVEVGAPASRAVAGINEMWKRKGRIRRAAGLAYAHLARFKPSPVFLYLSKAAKSSDDPSLRPIGMRGLCNSLRAGFVKVIPALVKASQSDQVKVRQIAIECVADHPDNNKASALVAGAMAKDSSAAIRAESARVLAKLATTSTQSKVVGAALSKMVRDSDKTVRVIAIKALATLPELPKAANKPLARAFANGDDSEKLELLQVAAKFDLSTLTQLGIADASSVVRIASLDTAITTGTKVASTMSSALSDSESSVRRIALQRLAGGKHGMSPADVDKALSLAIRDEDPSIANVAMLASAKLGDPSDVAARLKLALQDRSEIIRGNAVRASAGLIENSAKVAVELLTPSLRDSSHDVRVTLLAPLASAYAATLDQAALKKLLLESESQANRRLVVTGAFLVTAMAGEEERTAVLKTLASIEKSGSPFAKEQAALAIGLLKSSADGLLFLAVLVP